MGRIATSKHLNSASDLLIRARIKPDFVDTLDAVSYASRIKLVSEALFDARASTREYQLVEPFADVTARIQSLESFRIALIGDPPDEIILAATFDRAWEPYMRLIWQPLGTFLDLIFCNCVDYPLAATNDFTTYAAWVRAHQIDSAFFYAATDLSVTDLQYLEQLERLQRQNAVSDASILAMRATDPSTLAQEVRLREPAETLAQGIEGLSVLYRLTDLYRPGTPDGAVLVRAAKDLLKGWDPDTLPAPLARRLEEQLTWFKADLPQRAPGGDDPAFDKTIVQAGIVSGFGSAEAPPNHGCLLLLHADEGAGARGFLSWLKGRVTTAAGGGASDAVQTSLGVTCRGLRAVGLGDGAIAAFPKEFQEGMEARAGLLGDVRASHPRRWALPPQNWPPGRTGAPPVELSEVDFVVQLRVCSDHPGWDVLAADGAHPLLKEVKAIAAAATPYGVRLLSVETMRRASDAADPAAEHFGFRDGISQPHVRYPSDSAAPGTVAIGDFVLGFRNERGDPPPRHNPDLHGGSFLVIRKLQQDVASLQKLLGGLLADESDLFLAKMMGRHRNGTPLADCGSKGLNDFVFGDDDGSRCPLQSHIRRANPRHPDFEIAPPRLMRRGMSFGPPAGSNDPAPRGTFFMTYGSSIAEQFEVVQRWINGGNSTGVFSRHADPIAGTSPANREYVYRFAMNGRPRRVTIAEPLVTLQWGLYLFIPSLAAISRWVAMTAAGDDRKALAERGRAVIARIAGLPEADQGRAWTLCLEDFTSRDPAERGDAGAVWAAIRAMSDGVLRVPFGRGPTPGKAVLVADPALVETVLREDHLYSMADQKERMKKSFGEIFLGLDAGKEYTSKSAAPVALLQSIGEAQAFAVARGAADKVLDGMLDFFATIDPKNRRAGKIDCRRDYLPKVLGAIATYWFGFPDGADGVVAEGGWSWTPAEKPRCPGSFVAPSRYCFYPDPSATVTNLGQVHGGQLRAAISGLFGLKGPNSLPDAHITKSLAKTISDPDELARTLVGVMIGFLPPAEANMRLALYGWTKEKSLHRVQRALLTSDEADAYARATAALLGPLKRAMQQRPAPETLWRTAVAKHHIGATQVEAGDTMIVGLVSATAQAALDGSDDIYPVFGGDRSAENHPVHACPAYKFAIGTMLGVLSALLERRRLEILPAPLIIRLTEGPGWRPPPDRPASA